MSTHFDEGQHARDVSGRFTAHTGTEPDAALTVEGFPAASGEPDTVGLLRAQLKQAEAHAEQANQEQVNTAAALYAHTVARDCPAATQLVGYMSSKYSADGSWYLQPVSLLDGDDHDLPLPRSVHDQTLPEGCAAFAHVPDWHDYEDAHTFDLARMRAAVDMSWQARRARASAEYRDARDQLLRLEAAAAGDRLKLNHPHAQTAVFVESYDDEGRCFLTCDVLEDSSGSPLPTEADVLVSSDLRAYAAVRADYRGAPGSPPETAWMFDIEQMRSETLQRTSPQEAS